MRVNKEIISIKSSTLSQNIAERLVEAIVSGKLIAGVRLNESELSRQLQVSRAPIREALNQLQEQGLVVHHPRRGMFVVSLSDSDIFKIQQLRVALESEALLLCRENLTPANERRLVAQLEKMEKAGDSISSLEAVRLDIAFHQTIWSQSDNQYLERILTSLTAPLFAYALINRSLAGQRTILDSHRPLLTFIQGGMRKGLARQVMIDHITLRWGQLDSQRLKQLSSAGS
ncbi:MAG: GntR family transcriptional regulator [Acidobacteria bacterium]|nr:GntR family transcriptional regulator [Acidobacteriota bacterium]